MINNEMSAARPMAAAVSAAGSVVNIWAGDQIMLPSGALASVRRWVVQRNKTLGLPDERVAEVELSSGQLAEFSERLMSLVVKVGA